ncbi:hypothetical protein V6Z12_D13G144900 [Gossypium hirsutum]
MDVVAGDTYPFLLGSKHSSYMSTCPPSPLCVRSKEKLKDTEMEQWG